MVGTDLSHDHHLHGKSCVDLKAATYCDLHCLSISSLVNCLSLYPDFALIFADRLAQHLSINLIAEVSQTIVSHFQSLHFLHLNLKETFKGYTTGGTTGDTRKNPRSCIDEHYKYSLYCLSILQPGKG